MVIKKKMQLLKKTASKSDVRKMKTQEQILKMKKREQKEFELREKYTGQEEISVQ